MQDSIQQAQSLFEALRLTTKEIKFKHLSWVLVPVTKELDTLVKLQEQMVSKVTHDVQSSDPTYLGLIGSITMAKFLGLDYKFGKAQNSKSALELNESGATINIKTSLVHSHNHIENLNLLVKSTYYYKDELDLFEKNRNIEAFRSALENPIKSSLTSYASVVMVQNNLSELYTPECEEELNNIEYRNLSWFNNKFKFLLLVGAKSAVTFEKQSRLREHKVKHRHQEDSHYQENKAFFKFLLKRDLPSFRVAISHDILASLTDPKVVEALLSAEPIALIKDYSKPFDTVL